MGARANQKGDSECPPTTGRAILFVLMCQRQDSNRPILRDWSQGSIWLFLSLCPKCCYKNNVLFLKQKSTKGKNC